ncbi:tetratricopeptide repeat-containing sensor histidine kinase [Niabella aquatica]
MGYRFYINAFFAIMLISGCEDKATRRRMHSDFPNNSTPPDSILSAAKKLRNGTKQEKTLADIYMSIYYGCTSGYPRSKYEYGNALKLASKINDSSLIGMSYIGLAHASKNLGEYPEALTLFSKALAYYRSDSVITPGIYANIAQVFQLQNDLKQASTHLRHALTFSANNKDNIGYLLALHALANVQGMSGAIDSALILDEEGIAISKKIKNRATESTFLDNKANCFMYSNRPDSARYYFSKSLLIDSSLGNRKQMSDTWLNLGELERMYGNSKKAELFLKHAINLANSVGYRNGVLSSYQSLSQVYAKRGEFEKALNAESAYSRIKDSIINLKRETAVAEWKAVYETEKKEDEIKLQRLQLKQKNTSIWLISICSILLLSMVYFANKRNKERKEKIYREALFARDKESAGKILIAEETERKRIAADLHDGVGQTLTAAWLNLQAVHPQIESFDSENATLLRTTTQLIGNSCAEIRQISHNMMPDILFQKGLIPAIRSMISTINQQHFFVSLSAEEYDISLDKTTELIVYRIIQECVSNVVRHSQATELYISINKEEQNIAVMIEDNGIGFDQNSQEDKEGIGMQNIRSRVQYLHGSVEWNHVNPDKSGTVVAVYIPIYYEPIS